MFISPQDGARIARELKATIERDVNIMDRNGTIIASTDPRRIGQVHAVARRLIQEGLSVLEVADADLESGMQAGVNLPIHVDGVCEGVIGITGPATEVRVFGTIAKKMAEILLASMVQQQQRDLLERARNVFIEEWLFAQEPDWATLPMRAQLLGIDVEQPRCVAILQDPAGRAGWSGGAAQELRSGQFLRIIEPYLQEDAQNLCAVVNQRILLLFGSKSLPRATRILEDIQREGQRWFGAQLSGGLSTASRGAEDLRRCYTEAKIAASVSAREGRILEYSNSSLKFVLQNIDAKVKRDVLQTVFPPMEPAERTELVQCLQLYFQYDGGIEAAAAAACVHPNTFRYRMQKVCQLTSYDLRKPRDAVMLYLALQFMS